MVKYIEYFLLASAIFITCFAYAMFLRDMHKRVQRIETLTDRTRKQMRSKAIMDDKHIIALAMEITDLKKRIRYAEKVIGYEYPEKEGPEC